MYLHSGNKVLHSFIDRCEGVLANNGTRSLVIEFEIDPINCEISMVLRGTFDEITT